MIKYSIENNIAKILLNRPEKRNALHPDLVNQFKNKLDEAYLNDKVKVIILSGEGKHFCAGADLEYLNQLKDYSPIENEKDSEELAELFLKIYKSPKPVIAAVNGAAIAGGCGLASVCDFIVAHGTNSKFGYSEVKIGFVPAIVAIFLIRKIGEGRAKQLLMTGEIIDGNKAYEIGLANYLAGNVLDEANNLAELIIKNSSQSMNMTKNMIQAISNFNIDEAVDYCIRLNAISRSTEDFSKGLSSFLNKK